MNLTATETTLEPSQELSSPYYRSAIRGNRGPYLGNPEREDLNVALWVEAIEEEHHQT